MLWNLLRNSWPKLDPINWPQWSAFLFLAAAPCTLHGPSCMLVPRSAAGRWLWWSLSQYGNSPRDLLPSGLVIQSSRACCLNRFLAKWVTTVNIPRFLWCAPPITGFLLSSTDRACLTAGEAAFLPSRNLGPPDLPRLSYYLPEPPPPPHHSVPPHPRSWLSWHRRHGTKTRGRCSLRSWSDPTWNMPINGPQAFTSSRCATQLG